MVRTHISVGMLSRMRRPLAVALLVTLASTALLARNLRSIDALASAAPSPEVSSLKKAATGGEVTIDSRLGVPSFLWAQRGGDVTAQVSAIAATAPANPVAAARAFLGGLGSLYRLAAQNANDVPLLFSQPLPNGGAIVKFRNQINGIEVFREDAAVLLGADLNLVAIGGFITGGDGTAPFAIPPESAAAVALEDWSFAAGTAAQLRAVEARDGYQHFDLAPGTLSADGSQLAIPVRVKPVLFRLPTQLVPAYYVEVQVRDGRVPFGVDSYAYVVSATDATVLFRHNQTADVAFSYRVFAELGGNNLPFPGPTGRNGFPHPTGVADGYQGPFVTPNLISLQNLPFSRNDPWLAPGATTTLGNNVEAFADLVTPDNFGPVDPAECNTAVAPAGGDFHACTNALNTFDYSYNTAAVPNVSKSQVMASVTNLFYMNNWLHDWFYDAGFDEVSGNAQTNNFGRGGAGNDSIFAEGQDFAALNNANMSTPADGWRPRMRMYVYSGAGAQLVKITAPAAIAGIKTSGIAAFGPQAFDRTNAVAYPPVADRLACAAFSAAGVAAVTGKIALIDIGNCGFEVQVKNAQNAGAVAVLLANNAAGIGNVGGTDPTITIPTMVILQSDGTAIKSQLALPAVVSARVARAVGINRDGTLDNGIIAHEWGHYISNRLVANASGLTTNLARGMGEGWADFHSMLMLVKGTDSALTNNANFGGTYAMGSYVRGVSDLAPDARNNAFYTGIRRYPYSRDLTKNPLTFRHVTNGVALPASPAPAFGADGANNAEVHNTGEVWASMLWECYSNLLNDTTRLTFAQAQDRMKRYLVGGYKLTPAQPTFTEARDALLAVIRAQDLTDHALCYAGFAKRGAGIGAVSPDRFSSDNSGVVESFAVGGAIAIDGAVITDAPAYCDADGFLDNGETGTLTVSLRNVGTTTLSATTGTVSSSNAKVTFPNGVSFSIPASTPGQSFLVTLPIRLLGAVGIETTNVTVSVSDPGFAVASPVTSLAAFRINVDQKPNQSATDNVESTNTTWTTGTSAANPTASMLWKRIELGVTDHRWLGPDGSSPQINWLQSPLLNVAASGNFSFTFRHRFSFEFDAGGNYDGGQIQISTDNGVTWSDIGASASPGYSGVLLLSGAGNPLEGLNAYVQTSPAYPALETVTVSLGTAYAGQSVRVRFVIGTDNLVGAPGWEIDDVAFTNISNTPFDAVIAQAGACYSITAQAGSVQTTGVGTPFGTVLRALVKNGSGNPVSGKSVIFTLPSTGATGTFAAVSSVTTDVNGVASAPILTANTTPGSFSATATAGLQTAAFALTNAACRLDLDRDGVVLPQTDGLLLMRYIANLTPSVDLTANAKNPTSVVTAATIQNAVEAMRAGLFIDVDGDNVVNSKDALIVMRALLGFRDTGLTGGLQLSSSARKTGAELRSWLVSNCGLILP
ncbi:MAG: M36 family metallopeptidase [Rhizobacter sp.]|nr:M36 family metallopeptidase [Burkholderiales bacterium]